MKLITTFFITLLILTLNAQTSTLKLQEIMSGNTFIGEQPFNPQWNPDGNSFIFSWNPAHALIAPYYHYTLKSKKLIALENFDSHIYPVQGFHSSPNNLHHYFTLGNAIFKWNNEKSTLLYDSDKPIKILKVTDKNELIIRQDLNIYFIATANFKVQKATNIRAEKAPKNQPESDYLVQQQEKLFDYIKNKNARTAASKTQNEKFVRAQPVPFYLENWRLDDVVITDNLEKGLLFLTEHTENAFTHFDNFITEDGYVEGQSARPKVGSKNPVHHIVLYHPKDSVQINVNFDQLSGISERPAFHQEFISLREQAYKKELIFHNHGLNDSNDKCLVEIKSYDNKDRWIGYIALESGEFIELEHQNSESWIGGPGISGWNMVPGTVGWTSADEIYYQSEKTGYSHLYTMDIGRKKVNQLTEGLYEVHDAVLSLDKKSFFITSNQSDAGNRSFYQLLISSKKMIPILTEDGNHQVLLSPDQKNIVVRYSNKNNPWELYTARLIENADMTQLTDSKSTAFKQYNWREPDLVKITAADGIPFNARLYTPNDNAKNGAAIFFVHGAGYLQNAHNWWSLYYREYMFHNLLCDLGYTIIDIDYRGSEGYGSAFRTGIYRHMGGKDLSDHLDARRYLIQHQGIDSTRIGIYGGSYGGFITLMALLTEPGKFKCGAALRSVTDWAHYNHPYTSNILNTPAEDPLSFERSSPIYFANNLADRLLMLHGMVDDNVQYQDVVRLSQRFIELGKTKWDLIGYPVESHGFVQTSSWVDEYRRILELFNEELLPN